MCVPQATWTLPTVKQRYARLVCKYSQTSPPAHVPPALEAMRFFFFSSLHMTSNCSNENLLRKTIFFFFEMPLHLCGIVSIVVVYSKF